MVSAPRPEQAKQAQARPGQARPEDQAISTTTLITRLRTDKGTGSRVAVGNASGNHNMCVAAAAATAAASVGKRCRLAHNFDATGRLLHDRISK